MVLGRSAAVIRPGGSITRDVKGATCPPLTQYFVGSLSESLYVCFLNAFVSADHVGELRYSERFVVTFGAKIGYHRIDHCLVFVDQSAFHLAVCCVAEDVKWGSA